MFTTFYDNMKAKVQKGYNTQVHYFNLLNAITSMFDWQGLPDTIRPEILESILSSEGTVGVAKFGEELWCGPGGYCGEVKGLLPTEYQITVTGVGHEQGLVGEKLAVCWNNNTATPDFPLIQTASILGEIDVSEKLNVLFSRLLRIPKVHDQKEKDVVERAIKAIINGNVEAVVSDNIKDQLLEEKTPQEFLDLIDVKDVDKLQYLAGYRDEIIKRFFQIYGQDTHANSKRAQQSVEEITGTSALCMIVPEQRLYQRKKFCEQMNSMFGTNVTVEYSKCWQDTINDVTDDDKDGVDDTEEKPEEKEGDDNEPSNSENQ